MNASILPLNGDELVALIRRVFAPNAEDGRMAFLVDLPSAFVADEPAWAERRALVLAWWRVLAPRAAELGLDGVDLVLYTNVRAQNADLPATGWRFQGEVLPATAEEASGEQVSFAELFRTHKILVAPTRFSATAPLKVAARTAGFRAATMPGFIPAMVPALRLDYDLIAARVAAYKALLDEATGCDLLFEVGGAGLGLHLDLRHRTAHASDGLLRKPGMAGNLPSGEAYVVPYEGEKGPSSTRGLLPVQHGDEVVIYEIEANAARRVLTQGPASEAEAARLRQDPAYGNLAELGLGVLGDMGVEPTGEILLDEKLGLHIAFGRSDHFGGQVGPRHFSSPDRVIHLDHVYIPRLQPKVHVVHARLTLPDREVLFLEDGRFLPLP